MKLLSLFGLKRILFEVLNDRKRKNNVTYEAGFTTFNSHPEKSIIVSLEAKKTSPYRQWWKFYGDVKRMVFDVWVFSEASFDNRPSNCEKLIHPRPGNTNEPCLYRRYLDEFAVLSCPIYRGYVSYSDRDTRAQNFFNIGKCFSSFVD